MVLRSLFSGVSGLQSHQTRMDVISNNIANVNTTGYKASRVRFQDIISETLEIATAPEAGRGGQNPMQVGLGTTMASIQRDESQGAINITGGITDLAIQGNGFFVLRDGETVGEHYTRDGSFSVDADGNLVLASNGFRVQGYNSKFDTQLKEYIIDETGPVEDIKIDLFSQYGPNATSKVQFGGNLDAEAQLRFDPIRVGFTKNGVSDEVEIRFSPVAPGKNMVMWKVYDPNEIDPNTGDYKQITTDQNGTPLVGILEYDEDGNVIANYVNTADDDTNDPQTDIIKLAADGQTQSIELPTDSDRWQNVYGTTNPAQATNAWAGYDFFTVSMSGNNYQATDNGSATTVSTSGVATFPNTPLSSQSSTNYPNGFVNDAVTNHVPVQYIESVTSEVIQNSWSDGGTPARGWLQLANDNIIDSSRANPNQAGVMSTSDGTDEDSLQLYVDGQLLTKVSTFSENPSGNPTQYILYPDTGVIQLNAPLPNGVSAIATYEHEIRYSVAHTETMTNKRTTQTFNSTGAASYDLTAQPGWPGGGVQLIDGNLNPGDGSQTIKVTVNGVEYKYNPAGPAAANEFGYSEPAGVPTIDFFPGSPPPAGASAIQVSYVHTGNDQRAIDQANAAGTGGGTSLASLKANTTYQLDFENIRPGSVTVTVNGTRFTDVSGPTGNGAFTALNAGNNQFSINYQDGTIRFSEDLIGDEVTISYEHYPNSEPVISAAANNTQVLGAADFGVTLDDDGNTIGATINYISDIENTVNGLARDEIQINPASIQTISLTNISTGTTVTLTNATSTLGYPGNPTAGQFTMDYETGDIFVGTDPFGEGDPLSVGDILTLPTNLSRYTEKTSNYAESNGVFSGLGWMVDSIPDAEAGNVQLTLGDLNRGLTVDNWVPTQTSANITTWPNETSFPNTNNLTRRVELNYEWDDRVNILIPNGITKKANPDATSTGDITPETFQFKPNISQVTASGGDHQADTGDPVAVTFKNPTEYQYNTSARVYDSLGTAHDINITFERIGTNKWLWSVPEPSTAVTGTDATEPRIAGYGVVAFDADGRYDQANSYTFESPIADTTSGKTPDNNGFQGIYFDPAQLGGAGPPEEGADPVRITVNFTDDNGDPSLFQTATNSDAVVTNQNGFPPGDLERFSFNEEGFIVGLYNNGRSQNLARIALQNFVNPAGLMAEGSNLFLDTVNAGKIAGPMRPGFDGLGTIVPGALEQSNVDLSVEFVDMIITQRGFQANTRTITTADRFLQELLTLVQ